MPNANMKGFLTILTLVISLSVNATHLLTYYVYYETEYSQGPWKRLNILEESDYKYLAPESFTDLFGSEDIDLVNKMISRLKDNKPDVYNWNYEVSFSEDTVILTTKAEIEKFETVKNEITATLTLNSFKAVTFRFNNLQETLTIDDLTLPYLDLVKAKRDKNEPSTSQGLTKNTAEIKVENNPKQQNEIKNEEGSSLTIWLIISVIINVGLVALLIMKKKR